MRPAVVATDHPAKWSRPVLDAIAEIAVDQFGLASGPMVLDPFAGMGRARLEEAISATSADVTGVELQPEWGDDLTVTGDATDLPAGWTGAFAAIITSPTFGNRMADHHDAADPCGGCNGSGIVVGSTCMRCKGTGLSWRNTYAHSLRRQGADLIPGSAAGLQWGPAYRELHRDAMTEMIRVVREDGLLVVNMSNHIRAGVEQLVVEWWLAELLYRQCSLVEVRRVATRRQRHGANAEARVAGEVVMVLRTPSQRTLL